MMVNYTNVPMYGTNAVDSFEELLRKIMFIIIIQIYLLFVKVAFWQSLALTRTFVHPCS